MPADGYCAVWFSHDMPQRFTWGAGDHDRLDLGPAEFARRMTALALEYRPRDDIGGVWHSTSHHRAWIKPLLDGVAESAVTILRDTYGAHHPTELLVHVSGNAHGIPDLRYVARALGIAATES